MADEKDPMACLDMQNYLHTESDCLEMWKGALQDVWFLSFPEWLK